MQLYNALYADGFGNITLRTSGSGGSASNPAAGPTGSAVPTAADYIGFSVGGNLVGVSSSNPLPVTSVVSSSALPTGAATSANQATGNSSLATIATNTTGAATSANQTTGNTSLATISTNIALMVPSQGIAGDTTITTGGSAQTLFSGATPVNGFAIYNPDLTNDLWISDSTTASANGQGSIRVPANGGGYETPSRYKPIGPVSIVGSATGQKITAREW
jgi:hypothetical protein